MAKIAEKVFGKQIETGLQEESFWKEVSEIRLK